MIVRFLRKIRPFLPIPDSLSVGFVFGSSALAMTVLLLVWNAIPQSILPFSKSSLIGFSLISVLRVFLCLLLPLVFFASRYHADDPILYGSHPGFGAIIHSILLGLPVMLIFISLHNLLIRFLILRSVRIPPQAFYFTTRDGSGEALLLYVAVGVILPILAEELLFRGLMTGSLPGILSNRKGTVIVAFLFAVFMLNPIDFFSYFLLGLLLGYIRLALDNTLCCVLTRLSMIGSYFLFQPLLPNLDVAVVRTEADIDPTVMYISITALIMGTIILFPILSQIRRISGYLRLEKMDEPPKTPGSLREHFGWSFLLGILFFTGLWVTLIGV
ncbi:MAG: CPBP family intramembrane metalloprotease [Clostridiaceae bacterium]|nr:CPBP family intramembrane metalloprotease [Clostridiaceae bacterium]